MVARETLSCGCLWPKHNFYFLHWSRDESSCTFFLWGCKALRWIIKKKTKKKLQKKSNGLEDEDEIKLLKLKKNYKEKEAMFSGVKSISADKLQKYIKDGSKVTIMDIRPVEEYTHSRIPGSIHYDTAGTQTIFPIVVLVCLNGLHSIERYSAIQKFALFKSCFSIGLFYVLFQ